MSVLTWCITVYIVIGIFIMTEALVEAWTWPEYDTWTKILGSIISILVWPVLFFMN